MSLSPVWSIRHAVTRLHGCDLAVTWRPDGWLWAVTVAGEPIARGMARSQEGAQDAAIRAAQRHVDDGGRMQLPLF